MLSNLIVPPKRWRRRMDKIRAGLPKIPLVEELNEKPINLARLNADEQGELCRLMAEVQRAGLAGLSDGDLERFLCLRVILDGDDNDASAA